MEEGGDEEAAGGEEEEEALTGTMESGAVLMGGAEGLEPVRGLWWLVLLLEALTRVFVLLVVALWSLCSAATLVQSSLSCRIVRRSSF